MKPRTYPGALSPLRSAAVLAGLCLAFGVVALRLVHLHVMDEGRMAQFAEAGRERTTIIPARRGDITDRKGRVLATQQEVYTVGVDPQFARLSKHTPEGARRVAALAALLSMPESELLEKAKPRLNKNGRPVRWVKLKAGVDAGLYGEIVSLQLKGVYGNRSFQRVYPAGSLAAHVLGFTNKEGTAVSGIEAAQDTFLRGYAGWLETERDGRRRELVQFRSRAFEPTHGLNVQLTIDAALQHAAEAQVNALVQAYSPQRVSIIVSNPISGELLAMASYPSFNPNTYWEAEMAALKNSAITDVYEPGSTFKIVPIGAALNEGLTYMGQQINCSAPTAWHKGREVKLPKDHKELGTINLETVVAKSSNRGAAQLGIRLGEASLHGYARAFGFGQVTGLGLTGESAGLLHAPENWDGLTITRMPMGHAIAATPLQLHQSMATVAAGGVRMQPTLVRKVTNTEGETVWAPGPQVQQRVLTERTAASLREMLQGVVAPGGTARNAAMPGFHIAGKTGTTQKIVNGRYSNQHHVASFVGMFPAQAPEVVISVVVDEPQLTGYGYGGRVAAPAFVALAQHAANTLGMRPQQGEANRALAANPSNLPAVAGADLFKANLPTPAKVQIGAQAQATSANMQERRVVQRW